MDPAYVPPAAKPGLQRVDEERGVVVVGGRRPFGTAAVLALLGLVLVLVLAGALVWALSRRPAGTVAQTTTSPPTATVTTGSAVKGGSTVPSVIGQQEAVARRQLTSRGLGSDVRRTPSSRPRGIVLAQSPGAGTRLQRRAKVVLVVAGPAPAASTHRVARLAVPGVTGMSERTATAALEKAGFRVVSATRPSTEAVGTVVVQDPAAAAHANRGTTVHIEVAVPAGPPKVLMPRIAGLTLAEAESQLHSRGLRVNMERVISAQPAGTVLSQSPVAGAQLRRGMTVSIHVASPPAKVDLPDVTGLDAASARQQLTDAGFRVQVVDEPVTDSSQDGVVIDENPAGGSSATKGSTVTITVGQVSSP